MNLKSVKIDDYKLLKGFEITFNKNVSILIGINGSGKSSLLEAIAIIFSNSVLKQTSRFGFEIQYDLRLEEVLEQTATSSEFRTDYITVVISASSAGVPLQYAVYVEDKILTNVEEIERRFNKFSRILPSEIVIYYSGLSEVMKEICEPHNQILAKQYREGISATERIFFYFEPAALDLMLLALLSFEYGDIPEFLATKAKITEMASVQIFLKKPDWAKGNAEELWGARGEVRNFFESIKTLSGDVHSASENSTATGNIIIEITSEETIVVTIISKQKLFEVREHFVDEKAFFRVMHALYIDGFWNGASFHFEAQGDVSFSSLSEGEQQAIIVKGLTELLVQDNSLFLFDEPDTYLHPSWQRTFIEEIIQFSELNNSSLSQFIITTHSPQLLSNARPESSEVKIIEDAEIIEITPKYYGRDISTVLYEMMGVERRNNKVAKLLSGLFNIIERRDLQMAKNEYQSLANLLGEDDPAIVRAKTQIDFLEEEINEANR